MTTTLRPRGAFLHLPRTGGTWVYRVLTAANLVGVPIGKEHSFGHHEKWAFTVVRNPVDWWLSLWRFQCDNGWPQYTDGAHPLYPVNAIERTDLEGWVNAATELTPGLCGEIFESFTRKATYVLQTENLSHQLQIMAEKVNWPKLPVGIPRANVSKTTGETGSIFTDKILKTEPHALKIWQMSGVEALNNFCI